MIGNITKTLRKTIPLIFLLFIVLFSSQLHADAGPKPSMKFTIEYKTSKPVKLIEGWQFQSQFETFNVYDSLNRKGPQGFHASQDKAKSVAFSYEQYHKLILKFDDKVRESNVFENESFNSSYMVTVFDDKLEVKDTTAFMKDSSVIAAFIKALLLTLALELMVAFVYLKLARKPLKILFFVILANLITLPIVWFLFPMIMNSWAILVGEIFAFVTEALFLMLTCRKWFKPSGAFLLSFMMNVMSLLIGGFALILMIGF
jgi:hypothetical protein